MPNFSSLAGLKHTFLVWSDNRYSDDKTTTVQLGWDLSELGKPLNSLTFFYGLYIQNRIGQSQFLLIFHSMGFILSYFDKG